MLRVRVTWSGIGGTPYLSTFYFDGLTQTDADNAVTAVGTALALYDGLVDNQVTWATDPEVPVMDEATGQSISAFSTTPLSGTGAQSSSNLPFATQGLLRLRTGVFVSGREIRGRLFLPGLVSASNTDGTVTPANKANIDSWFDGLRTDANSVWVVWSRKNGQVATITSNVMWTQWASLRTRRPSF